MGDVFKATLMDCHDELRAGWERAIEGGGGGEVAGFGAPVVTEDEVGELSRGWNRNPERNSLAESWVKRTREALRCR